MDRLNKNWRKYIRRGDDVFFCCEIEEQVCAWITFVFGVFFLVFFGFFGALCSAFLADVISNVFVARAVSVVIFVPLYVMAMVAIYMHNRSIKYVLSEKGVYEISGWWLKSVTFVSYDRITDVHMSRGIIDAICKTGCVHIDTASGNTVDGTSVPELSIAGIAEYEEIYDFILSKVK